MVCITEKFCREIQLVLTHGLNFKKIFNQDIMSSKNILVTLIFITLNINLVFGSDYDPTNWGEHYKE